LQARIISVNSNQNNIKNPHEVKKMEYVYAAMLLHKAGKPVNEENLNVVLNAAGVNPDAARVKALVAALEGVNIEEAIKTAPAFAAAAPAAQAPAAPAKEEKKEETKKEDEKQKEEAALEGLGALFG
jgi:large subunit ribosomal protein L12